MRTEEEIKVKLISLREVAHDIQKRSDKLFREMSEGLGHLPMERLESINEEIGMMRNRAFELLANARAMKWCLGEIDDIDFAMNTAAGIIENAQDGFDTL